MSDLYRARCLRREGASALVRVLQIHPDACALRAMNAGDRRVAARAFAGRLLAEASDRNAIRDAVPAHWEPNDFAMVVSARLERFEQTSLIALVDRGGEELARFIAETGYEALDPAAYEEIYGQPGEDVVRDDPSYYANFNDEADLLVVVGDPKYLAHVREGHTWTSAAFG